IDALGGVGEENAEGEISGSEGEIPMQGANPQEQPMESLKTAKNKLLNESKTIRKNQVTMERIDLYDKTMLINEEFDNMLKSLVKFK
ncbi:MAG: hypothetical protein IKV87_08185, partial [Methanobrevibacter sp.]|nr:hypothetical protein [Methanobrevibacter sp.]